MKSDLVPKIAGTVTVSAIILIGAYFVLANNEPDDVNTAVTVTTVTQPEEAATVNTEPGTEAAPTVESTQPAEEVVVTTYTDGTYTAGTNYRVPGGDVEDITVTLTVSNDTIKTITVDTVATNDDSAEYQAPFDDLIVSTASGQDLDNADVSRLGGATLTSNAYNDVLDAIRAEARS